MYELLTKGALNIIMHDEEEIEGPVLQVLNYKKISVNNVDKYRLLLTDGLAQSSYIILESQLVHLVENKTLIEYSIIKLNQYVLSKTNNNHNELKKIVTIFDCEVLMPGHQVKQDLRKNNATAEKTANVAVSKSSTSQQIAQPAPQPNKLPANFPMRDYIFITPIAALSPYQNRWVIKARVTNKSPIRKWSNSRGEGKLFSMDLIDESDEIRCTAFHGECDRYYNMIEINKVYYISKCHLKSANTQFNHLKNEYEMYMTCDTQINTCNEESETIPSLQFNFESISAIETKSKDDLIDVLGIVKNCSGIQTFKSIYKDREFIKRDIGVVDANNDMINVTLWHNQAQNFNCSGNPVIAIKGAKIGEFNGGKNLSLSPTSVLQLNPDTPEAYKLRDWFTTVGATAEFRFLSKALVERDINVPWLTFRGVEENKIGHQDMPKVFNTKATINLIKAENALYKSCPSEGCRKKVNDQSNGTYRCKKCGKDYPNFIYRLLVNANLVDWTGNQWVVAFNEEAEVLLNTSASELGELKEKFPDTYMEKIAGATFKSYIFKIRMKQEIYNDEIRLKATIASVEPINYKNYLEQLLSKIKDLSNIKI